MKRLLFLSLAFALAFLFVACDSGNTGDFKISLKLPMDIEGVCGEFGLEDDEDEDAANDYTYCINKTDQISLVIYSKQNVEDDYVYADRSLIPVDNNDKGKKEFIRSLKKGNYYRFFGEVTNKNETSKLTGGIDGIYYDDEKNYEVEIFLAPKGDFVRVVGDRTDVKSDFKSLKSYFDDNGSKGSVAVALKDGRIYMAGGYDMEEDEVVKKAVTFDMKSISSSSAASLPKPLFDHVAALLDDKTETGKVVVGFGTSEDNELNGSLWVYDPKSDKYSEILDVQAVTKARAITIDGNVYVVGGCTGNGASNSVYRISSNDGKISAEDFATLKVARCNHAVADFSTYNEEGEKTSSRLLVLGGSKDFSNEGNETIITGGDFAEIINLETGSSELVAITDRNGQDDANLKESGLVAPIATGILMDDSDTNEVVATVSGGYLFDSENNNMTRNPRFFVFSEAGDKLIYDANSAPTEYCSRPSAALLGSEEKSVIKYVAVNCGSDKIERGKQDFKEQKIFVLQVKRIKSSELNQEIFSASVKVTLMEGNTDEESDGFMVDGPATVDAMGQVFMFGGKYVYQVGTYAIP